MYKHAVTDMFRKKLYVIKYIISEDPEMDTGLPESHAAYTDKARCLKELKNISRGTRKAMLFYHLYDNKRTKWVISRKPRFQSQILLKKG